MEILGRTVAANDYYNSMLNHYDMVVYRGITAYLKKFESDGDYALKFHGQIYGVVPKWLDEEFPLPPK